MSRIERVTAFIERQGEWYVAISPAYGVASQGETVDEAKRNLQEALELFLESADQSEVERRLNSEFVVAELELSVG